MLRRTEKPGSATCDTTWRVQASHLFAKFCKPPIPTRPLFSSYGALLLRHQHLLRIFHFHEQPFILTSTIFNIKKSLSSGSSLPLTIENSEIYKREREGGIVSYVMLC
ncbi:hypothetical protein ACOSP7_012736 [Xanthoceras sorbifolium]